jgi:hypothetical protein
MVLNVWTSGEIAATMETRAETDLIHRRKAATSAGEEHVDLQIQRHAEQRPEAGDDNVAE